jgi:hypothetical protein
MSVGFFEDDAVAVHDDRDAAGPFGQPHLEFEPLILRAALASRQARHIINTDLDSRPSRRMLSPRSRT